MKANRNVLPSNVSMLNKCREPLVGIEFLIEIINVPEPQTNYFVCVLCDATMGTHNRVKEHLVSVGHRVAYMREYFPKTLEPALRLLKTIESVTFPTPWMVERIHCASQEIENRFGRLKGTVADFKGFCVNREKWVSNIKQSYHFTEGDAFEVFDEEGLDHQLSLLGVVNDRPKKTQTARLFEEYCKRYTQMSTDITNNQKKYQKDPQSHPLYPAEWDIFWKARSAEFEKAGKDPYEHDFTREWSLYWLERMKELDKETIERRAREIRIALKMPDGLSTQEVEKGSKGTINSRVGQGTQPASEDKPSAAVANTNETKKRPSQFDVRPDAKRTHTEPKGDVRVIEMDLRHTLPRSIPPDQQRASIVENNISKDHRPEVGFRSTLKPVSDVSNQKGTSSDRNDRARNTDKDRTSDKARSTQKTDAVRHPGGSHSDRNGSGREQRDRQGDKARSTNVKIDADNRERNGGQDRQGAESKSAVPKQSDVSSGRQVGSSSDRRARGPDCLKAPDVPVRQATTKTDRNDRGAVGTQHRSDNNSRSVPLKKPETRKLQHNPLATIDLVDEDADPSDVDLRPVPMEIESVPTTSEFDADNSQDPVTVISVLRLLAAFEDLLGNSLGPKVVDLLSKAVALEKVRANLSDDLLVSEDNNILLETVKEKMKGLLLTGSVEAFKVQAVRKVIAHVNKINQIIGMRVKARQKQAMADARQSAELAKAKELKEKESAAAEFRKEVHHQLSTSLALQSKLITPEQLETLTNIYIQKHTVNDTPYSFGLEVGSRFPDIPRDGSNYLPELKQRPLLDRDFDLSSSSVPVSGLWPSSDQQPSMTPLLRNTREDIFDSMHMREEQRALAQQPLYDNDQRRFGHLDEVDQRRNRQHSPDRLQSSFNSQRIVTLGGGSHPQRPLDFQRHEFNDEQRKPSFSQHQISVDFDNSYQQQQQYPDEYPSHARQQQSHYSEALDNNHHHRRRASALPYDREERPFQSHHDDAYHRGNFSDYEERQRREMRMQMHREIHEAKLLEQHRQMNARYNADRRY